MLRQLRPAFGRRLSAHKPVIASARKYNTSRIPPGSVIFSGIQPTGVPHIGNYLGALRQWVDLQENIHDSSKLIYSIVDLHALTTKQDEQLLRQWKTETLVTLLAIGLDPERCLIFFQSDVPAHVQLMWILSCTASMGYLSRMTQWKSKLSLANGADFEDSNVKSKLKLGLFSYPVLQAADILVHGSTHVPVGEDQTQHLEFARECAHNFNSLYGQVLTYPQMLSCLYTPSGLSAFCSHFIAPASRIMSLKEPHKKMSKSHTDARSRILLIDKPEDIEAKVRIALTDSEPVLSYDPIRRPGVANLLDILSCFNGRDSSPESLVQKYQGSSMRVLKQAVASDLIKALDPIRTVYESIINNSSEITRVNELSKHGAYKAQKNSKIVLDKVHDVIGL